MDPLGDAMAGPPDPMSGGDPMGGAPIDEWPHGCAAAANIADGMEAANAVRGRRAAAADVHLKMRPQTLRVIIK